MTENTTVNFNEFKSSSDLVGHLHKNLKVETTEEVRIRIEGAGSSIL